MNKTFKVHVDQPCQENWDVMAPEENGRFCGSCTKTVIDFTQLTDAEVLSTLLNAGGNCCGRFALKQLDRPPGAHSAQRVPFKMPAVAAVAFTSFLLLQALPEAHAQQKTDSVPISLTKIPTRTTVDQVSAEDEHFVMGKIAPYYVLPGYLKTAKGKPLQGIRVTVKSLQVTAVTDPHGYFTLRIPRDVGIKQILSLELEDQQRRRQTVKTSLEKVDNNFTILFHPEQQRAAGDAAITSSKK